ncbi:DoxX family protein [Otariodibacter sp.]|uniref:DoxX family protein n=1 Tax=Otariodibacter sp. TaxID=3030919 RepID=UPI00262552B6|nr:DoxX family protein [Otariodibacter sp.]
MKELLDKSRPAIFLFVRILVGYMIFCHGAIRIWDFPIPHHNGGVPVLSFMGFGSILEIVGGILIFLGWYIRPAAFILCGEMAYAYFIMHASWNDFLLPSQNHGELAAIYALAFFLMFATGADKWSLDYKIRGVL